MKLLGVNLHGVYAERNPNFTGGTINIKQNIQIASIKKQSLTLVKENALDVGFSFLLNYGDYGKILLSGNVRFLIKDEKDLDKIIKDWENKTLDLGIRNHIASIINRKCTVRALQLEEELDFPLHVQSLMDKIGEDRQSKSQDKKDSKDQKETKDSEED